MAENPSLDGLKFQKYGAEGLSSLFDLARLTTEERLGIIENHNKEKQANQEIVRQLIIPKLTPAQLQDFKSGNPNIVLHSVTIQIIIANNFSYDGKELFSLLSKWPLDSKIGSFLLKNSDTTSDNFLKELSKQYIISQLQLRGKKIDYAEKQKNDKGKTTFRNREYFIISEDTRKNFKKIQSSPLEKELYTSKIGKEYWKMSVEIENAYNSRKQYHFEEIKNEEQYDKMNNFLLKLEGSSTQINLLREKISKLNEELKNNRGYKDTLKNGLFNYEEGEDARIQRLKKSIGIIKKDTIRITEDINIAYISSLVGMYGIEEVKKIGTINSPVAILGKPIKLELGKLSTSRESYNDVIGKGITNEISRGFNEAWEKFNKDKVGFSIDILSIVVGGITMAGANFGSGGYAMLSSGIVFHSVSTLTRGVLKGTRNSINGGSFTEAMEESYGHTSKDENGNTVYHTSEQVAATHAWGNLTASVLPVVANIGKVVGHATKGVLAGVAEKGMTGKVFQVSSGWSSGFLTEAGAFSFANTGISMAQNWQQAGAIFEDSMKTEKLTESFIDNIIFIGALRSGNKAFFASKIITHELKSQLDNKYGEFIALSDQLLAQGIKYNQANRQFIDKDGNEIKNTDKRLVKMIELNGKICNLNKKISDIMRQSGVDFREFMNIARKSYVGMKLADEKGSVGVDISKGSKNIDCTNESNNIKAQELLLKIDELSSVIYRSSENKKELLEGFIKFFYENNHTFSILLKDSKTAPKVARFLRMIVAFGGAIPLHNQNELFFDDIVNSLEIISEQLKNNNFDNNKEKSTKIKNKFRQDIIFAISNIADSLNPRNRGRSIVWLKGNINELKEVTQSPVTVDGVTDDIRKNIISNIILKTKSIELMTQILDISLGKVDGLNDILEDFLGTECSQKNDVRKMDIALYIARMYGLDKSVVYKWNESNIILRKNEDGSDIYKKSYIENIRAMELLEKRKPGSSKILYEKYGIANFARYPTDILLHQLEIENQNRPYGVIVYPESDYNGAFFQFNYLLENMNKSLSAGGYNIRIIEVASQFELAKRLNGLNKRYAQNGHKIDFLIIGGHGTPESVELSSKVKIIPPPIRTPDMSEVDYLSLHKLWINRIKGKNYGKLVAEDIKNGGGLGIRRAANSWFNENIPVVFFSCSTGVEGGIANTASEELGFSAKGPDRPTSPKKIIINFDENGKPKFNVEYNDIEEYGQAQTIEYEPKKHLTKISPNKEINDTLDHDNKLIPMSLLGNNSEIKLQTESKTNQTFKTKLLDYFKNLKEMIYDISSAGLPMGDEIIGFISNLLYGKEWERCSLEISKIEDGINEAQMEIIRLKDGGNSKYPIIQLEKETFEQAKIRINAINIGNLEEYIILNKSKLSKIVNSAIEQLWSFQFNLFKKFKKFEFEKSDILNIYDYFAIYKFTWKENSVLNPILRSGETKLLKPSNLVYLKQFEIALNKLGNYSGITYRGASIPKELFEKMKADRVFIDPGYISTSKNMKNGIKYINIDMDHPWISSKHKNDGVPVLFEIESKTGIDISNFTYFSNEEEVLFSPKTKFEIVDIIEEDGAMGKYSKVKLRQLL